ncbi:MAG: multicopper oxidase [Acidobacteriaceae bacterium]
MGSASRRTFLKLCAASAPGLAFAHGSFGAEAATPANTVEKLERYIDPLPIPPRHTPHGKRGDAIIYRVRMMEFERPLHSQLPPARLWGYEGYYPGPIFEAMRGQPIEVEWHNDLPTQHLFPVDTHIHGAMPPAPAVRTVPHLHGSRTDSISDGLPENWFTPGQSVLFHYPNDQQAAPLWYHDHALGITRLNVYAGLSGFYFLRDAQELSLNLPAGEYEIPLVLQDRTLDDRGQLAYTPSWDDGTDVPIGRWGPQFFGALPVVNGTVYPYLDVEPRMYRLRVLNAANSRFFHLYLNLAKSPTDIPALVHFQQIGSDGGLLAAPVAMQKLLMGPAERADLVVDFTGLEGRTVTLSNDAAAPYPGWTMLHELHPPLNELMQFRVTRPLSTAKAFSLPPALALARYDPARSVRTRDFVLTDTMDAQGRSLGMYINGKGYDAPTTELPTLGTQETWRFINTTDDSHPMHLHLVQYQILSRQGFSPTAFTQGKLQLEGNPRPPAPNEAGWKDTAVVDPYEVLTILVRFEGYTGKYVFHCHVAEHEDHDMMRPFQVVAGEPAAEPPAK